MADELWPGGPRFRDETDGFRLGADSVLLAHFAKAARVRKRRVIDLGCGSGLISILLAWDDPDLLVEGIEIRPRAACLAAENAKNSGVSDRMSVLEGDLRRHRELFNAGVYDLTVSNPPFYKLGSGKPPDNEETSAARGEEHCTLADVCAAASYLTRWGGSFALAHKPERLVEIFSTLTDAGFEPKRIRFVQHKQTSPPYLALIESRRGGKPSLNIEPPLILTNNDGSDSDEAKEKLRNR
ncbi:MAG: methyltransferase [Oscillospiraceae bacterium]|jgi:tRNA1(Val) A37 N6-methylase TrmN6|nr:methyltransferase [Oscillospiraceae bacterium]